MTNELVDKGFGQIDDWASKWSSYGKSAPKNESERDLSGWVEAHTPSLQGLSLEGRIKLQKKLEGIKNVSIFGGLISWTRKPKNAQQRAILDAVGQLQGSLRAVERTHLLTDQRTQGSTRAFQTFRKTLFPKEPEFRKAFQEGDIQKVVESLHKGDVAVEAEYDFGDNQPRTPLSQAILTGNRDLIQNCISYGANLDAVDRNGRTPIQLALTHPVNIEVLTTLLEYASNETLATAAPDLMRWISQDPTGPDRQKILARPNITTALATTPKSQLVEKLALDYSSLARTAKSVKDLGPRGARDAVRNQVFDLGPEPFRQENIDKGYTQLFRGMSALFKNKQLKMDDFHFVRGNFDFNSSRRQPFLRLATEVAFVAKFGSADIPATPPVDLEIRSMDGARIKQEIEDVEKRLATENADGKLGTRYVKLLLHACSLKGGITTQEACGRLTGQKPLNVECIDLNGIHESLSGMKTGQLRAVMNALFASIDSNSVKKLRITECGALDASMLSQFHAIFAL